MHEVLLYCEKMDPRVVEHALARLRVTLVSSRTELAERIVRDMDVLCVIIEVELLQDPWRSLLDSIARSFPLLNVAVICRECEGSLSEDLSLIGSRPEDPAFVGDIQNFAFAAAITNRRRNHRFDWPLRGQLELEGDQSRRYRVRALSCTGAFLECETDFPKPGARGEVRIEFQDFRMLTRCEVLDSRRSSSRLPSGFGIRFTGFSDRACRVIDRIIEDALVNTLLEPDAEPAAPTLESGDILTIGEELT
jgi:hypothetical protein